MRVDMNWNFLWFVSLLYSITWNLVEKYVKIQTKGDMLRGTSQHQRGVIVCQGENERLTSSKFVCFIDTYMFFFNTRKPTLVETICIYHHNIVITMVIYHHLSLTQTFVTFCRSPSMVPYPNLSTKMPLSTMSFDHELSTQSNGCDTLIRDWSKAWMKCIYCSG